MLMAQSEVAAAQRKVTDSKRSHFDTGRTFNLLVQTGYCAQIVGLVGMCVLLLVS